MSTRNYKSEKYQNSQIPKPQLLSLVYRDDIVGSDESTVNYFKFENQDALFTCFPSYTSFLSIHFYLNEPNH